MSQRDALLVLGAVALAIAVSAVLLAGSVVANASPDRAIRRPGIFFDLRNSPPPARTVSEAQRAAPNAVAPIVPLQRGVSDIARDAAGYLLVLLGTSATLVLAREQVISAYRASIGGWRAQLRVLGSGLAVLGVGFSAAALTWIVFLGSLAAVRSGPLGVPAALQIGLAVFSVVLVLGGVAALIGFAAVSWRLGDALFQLEWLRRFGMVLPAPLIALLGATLIYIGWQIPYIGVVAVVLALAYALGAVVTARLARPTAPQAAR